MSDKENLNNLTQEIWKSAESLRGKFKSYENQNIVLPMITIRRIECVLESWREQELSSLKISLPDANEAQLKKILTAQEKDFSFHNTSEWSLKKLMEDDSQLLAANFKDYLNAFSTNIQTIINHFEFKKTIDGLKNRGLLGIIIKQYAEQDLGLNVLSNLDMGYVYEELLRRFSEQSGGEAGEHFTPREVIRLMVELLQIQFTEEYQQILIYDPACGTGGMLSVAKRHILDTISDNQHSDKPENKIILYGQELQPQNFAICEAEMLLKADKSHIRLGNSLIPFNPTGEDKGDQLNAAEHRFDYMLSNPPFGVTWSDYKPEAEKFNSTRYKAGMPRTNDGALLFLQTMLAKMKSAAQGGSKIAVVVNGSPLSNGDCGSGESEIRRWIIENDWLDAIVMLPDQLFYNTGIFTYIWLLSNNKPDSHQGKVKIIDAREQFEKEPKSFGNKRNRMSDAHRLWIEEAYQQHWQSVDDERIKLFNPTDFAYHKVSVVFWQTDEHDQPAFVTEPYEKDLTAANVKREQDFYASEIRFDFLVSYDGTEKPLQLILQAGDSFTVCYQNALKTLFKAEIAAFLQDTDPKDKAKLEKAFFKCVIELDVSFYHRHYVEDNEYIPYGEDIAAFLVREIAKPIIRWQDSEQLGYEILPNKYFYRYQAPQPTADLLAQFWALEQEAETILKSLEA